MNVNEQLAQWGEPPVSAEEQMLIDLLDQALALQDRGLPVDLSALAPERPDLQQSSAEMMKAVTGLHQLAASVLEHSGILGLTDTVPPDSAQGGTTVPDQPRPPDPFPGEYRVVQLIGEGAYGQVWLAEHLNVGRRVALKALSLKEPHKRPQALESLRKEARVLGGIEHPNIVRVHDMRPSGDDWYLVLQYVGGGSFQRRLDEEKSLPWQQAARYVADVGEALLAVHRQGLVHRDVKPANILWDRLRDEALLTDFGLATRLSDGPGGGGTPLYMAPEAFEGQTTEASDVFSLAATLFCMVTGGPPFPGPSRLAVWDAARQGLPAEDPRFAPMPERLENLIRAALSAEPKQRPTLASFVADLRGALNQLLADTLAADAEAHGGLAPVDLRLLVTRQGPERQTGQPLASTHPPLAGLTRDLKRVPPPPERVLVRTGERVRVEVLASQQGHISVFNVGPSGNLNLLYPVAHGSTTHPVPAHRPLQILDVQLTPPAGRERLFAVWSARPLPVSPGELLRLATPEQGKASRSYRATRDMKRLQDTVGLLRPEEWHAVVLELDHQPAG